MFLTCHFSPKLMYRFSAIPIEILTGLCIEIYKLTAKFYEKAKELE